MRANDLFDIHFSTTGERTFEFIYVELHEVEEFVVEGRGKNPASDLATKPPYRDRGLPLHIAAEGYLFIHKKSPRLYGDVRPER